MNLEALKGWLSGVYFKTLKKLDSNIKSSFCFAIFVYLKKAATISASAFS